ncbi:ATPase WRNIP1 [Vitis vinifera]|uniref:ATPase WRNIP1 n=1 Tax=Vitis vinifera TaxID=29760 RepID=A0A438J3F0_VITVI|nr:ATPase WRNIP1 [Vitis vinifera]
MGPPGTGKTSIAKAIVNSSSQPSSYRFVSLSAVTAGVKDVRDVVEEARKIKVSKNMNSKRTLLFVDEVHRFNKSQQDSFLPVIEDGSIVFIGATTENPSFHLITPLLSRCRVLTSTLYSLVMLLACLIELLLTRAGDWLGAWVGRVLNCSMTTITLDDAKEALQSKHLAYDKAGEEHYNLISALHKSMRGDSSGLQVRMLDWLTPLPCAGCCLLPSLPFFGHAECNVNLAQCVAYLALAPKSVSVYRAILAAQEVVRESVGQNEGVPLHLRNAPTKLMKELGYGKGYIYPPDNPSSSTQNYLPHHFKVTSFSIEQIMVGVMDEKVF